MNQRKKTIRVYQIILFVFLLVYIFEAYLSRNLIVIDNFTIKLLSANRYLIFEKYEFYRIISSNFSHAFLMHFIINSLFLYKLGRYSEYLLGKKKFILFYLSSIIFLTVCLFFSNNDNYIIGSSGTIMSLLGFNFTHNKLTVKDFVINIGIIIIFIFSFKNMAHSVHILGFLFGTVYGLISINSNNKLNTF